MNTQTFILSALWFALIIVLANFSVQYPIFGTHLTYGALCYPLSFLLMNILSEKYSKDQVLRTLRLGLVLAFIPSIFAAEFRIACASFVAHKYLMCMCFFISNKDSQKFGILEIMARLWYPNLLIQ